MTNAARDAARLGTIYVYTGERRDQGSKFDLARNGVDQAVNGSVDEHIWKTSPYFRRGRRGRSPATRTRTAALTITYVLPTGVTELRRGWARNHGRAGHYLGLIVPIIPLFLPRDVAGA